MKKVISFLMVVAVIAISCNNNSEKFSLKPNLKPGEIYSMEYKMDIDQTVMGMNNNIRMIMGYQMKIKDVDARQDINVDFMYDHIAMNMKSAVLNMDYDSDSTYAITKESDDQASSSKVGTTMRATFQKIMGGFINKPITITLDSMGKVTEVRGYNELINSMQDSVSGITDKDNSFKKVMSEDQIKQIFDQAFATFPNKPVSIGEKWVKEFSVNQSGMGMKFKSTYKLLEVLPKENEAIVEVNAVISTPENTGKTTMAVPMNIKMNGTQNGRYTVDMTTGMIKMGKLNMDVKMEMEVMGQKVPMDMKGTTVITNRKQ